MKQKLLLLALLGLSCNAYGMPLSQCQTTETCAVGQTCGCKIMPSSAYNRYFFVKFTGLTQGQHYQCKLGNYPGYLIDLGGSTFPQGVTFQCTSDNCPHFPIVLAVDATLMSEPQVDMTLQYYVPASDIGFPVTYSCVSQ